MDNQKTVLPETKTIQTKVILGKGQGDFFLEVDFDFNETPFFMIHSVDTWVEVYDAHVINGNKIIFNAWVYKNIIYKTHCYVDECKDTVTVAGEIKHITKRIPLAGCVDVEVKGCEKLNPKMDIAETLDAYVIGDVEEKLLPCKIEKMPPVAGGQVAPPPNPCEEDSIVPPIYEYKKLHEKLCVKVEFKVVRWEHVKIEPVNHC